MIHIEGDLFKKISYNKQGKKIHTYYIKTVCVYCGKECFQNRYYFNKRNAFCNSSCSTSYNNKFRVISDYARQKASERAKEKYKGEGNPNWRGGPKKFKCNNCGNVFFLKRDRLADRSGKFCSLNCYSEHISENKIPKEQHKINHMMKNGIRRGLFHNINGKWSNYVDYSLSDLKKHLESKFTDGMTWKNHGVSGWHIDHIRPLCSFRYTDFDNEFKKCWDINNLQPLWAKDNAYKGRKHEKTSEVKTISVTD